MAITVPAIGDVVDATKFGIPVANQLNAAAVTAWTTLPLSNGWVASGYAQYRKSGDMVQLRGAVQDGVIAANTTIGSLPVGFRPIANLVYCTQPYYYAGWQQGVIAINNSGSVYISVVALTGTPQPLSLDRIAFSVLP